ncbi:hypothetical protein Cni_G15567 [Canna indica]|uniref:Import inner membrane translocase subunit n=1 Tax=Canna indica TaxID=4628 RepID=A0AAQ3KH83_9LILI|nr:hypothetical protein Cni_G15567 [Canna indica]
MAKPSKQMINGFRKLYSYQFQLNPSPRSPISWGQGRFLNSSPSASSGSSNLSPSADPSCSTRLFFPFISANRRLGSGTLTKLPSLGSGIKGLGRFSENGLGSGIFSIRRFNSGKFARFGSGLGKSAVDKPLSAISSVFSRYREAAGLQIDAFWRRNYMPLIGAGAVVVCIVLWRIMFGIASTFIELSEGMAKYGFLALASAIVAFAGIYLRSRFTINPDKVYRIAMRKLNTSAGILEVMGAPLAGTDVRAYVMSGGRPKLKNFKLKFGDKRCFLIFPIRGSERKGLVSVECKKKRGQYDMKLLAVDIPMASGPDQRLFLVGDEKEYKVGGGLISELRDPIVTAMAAEKEFDDLDLKEEEEEEVREREEAERKQQEEQQRAVDETEGRR